MRVTTIAYGVASIIIAAVIHYLVIPGIENCGSTTGIVSTYMSKDYSTGCQILTGMRTGAIAVEAGGTAIAVFGVFQRQKNR